jgi:hypothetical protein
MLISIKKIAIDEKIKGFILEKLLKLIQKRKEAIVKFVKLIIVIKDLI